MGPSIQRLVRTLCGVFFEDALGLKTDNGKEVWEFGDYMLDLIDISKMSVAGMKEYWLAAHFAQIWPLY